MKIRLWASGLLLAWLVTGCDGSAAAPHADVSRTPTTVASATVNPTPTRLTATATSTSSPIPTQLATPTVTLTATPEGGLAVLHTLAYSPWELVHDLAWSADGRWLAVAAGEVVRLYDGGSLALESTLAAGAWVSELAFPPTGAFDEMFLALAVRDGSLQVWELRQGILLASFHAHNKGANSLAFSPDGQLIASAGNDAILRLWQVQELLDGSEPLPVAEMIGGAFAVPAVRFSPDEETSSANSLLASVDLQAIRLRDPLTTRLVRTLRGQASVFAIEFHPQDAMLAAAEDAAGLRLWDIDSGEVLDYWQVEPAPRGGFLWDTAFSPDGARLAAVSSWGEVRVWSFPSGEVLADFRGHSRGVCAVAFSPDGRWLATGGLDGVVQVWAAP